MSCPGSKSFSSEPVSIEVPARLKMQVSSDFVPKKKPVTYQLGDFYCPDCDLRLPEVLLPFEHKCVPQPSKLRKFRESLCGRCAKNVDGVCLRCRDKFPDRPCSVSHAVSDPTIRCPDFHFLAVEMDCPDCGYHLAAKSGIDSCRKCGWRGLSRVALPGPLPPLKSNRLVIVAAPDEYSKEQLKLSGPRIKEYAEKCGADYFEIDYCEHPNWPLGAKWQAARYGQMYDQSLFLDCDVIIQNDPPDIFDLVPFGHWATIDEFLQSGKEFAIRGHRKLTSQFPDQVTPELTWSANAGVLVMPSDTAYALRAPTGFHSTPIDSRSWVSDQVFLTMEIDKRGLPCTILDPKWNWLAINDDFWDGLADAYFVHLNGLRPSEYRLALMERILNRQFTTFGLAEYQETRKNAAIAIRNADG